MQAATTSHETTIRIETTEVGTCAFLDTGDHQDLVVLGRADLLRLRDQVAAALLAMAG